jgi:hypothetical protein
MFNLLRRKESERGPDFKVLCVTQVRFSRCGFVQRTRLLLQLSVVIKNVRVGHTLAQLVHIERLQGRLHLSRSRLTSTCCSRHHTNSSEIS